MSSLAAWSYIAEATIWPAQVRVSDWDGSAVFGAPVRIDCDYSSEAKLMRDAAGEEFTAALTVYTEHAAAKPGDMVALGDHTSSPTPTSEARRVRLVKRDADTFERKADDFALVT